MVLREGVMKKTIIAIGMVFVQSGYALELMSNEELNNVSGQALIVADTIVGSGAGAGFTYTRMGLDAVLALNANINKFQLGCGGYNEAIKSNACDIDFDYVTLMGRSGSNPGDIGSDFVLTRPYIEIATKGSTAATREIAGVKIGAQSADGYFGIGRRYNNGATNLENGGTCGTGANALNCHSGINNVSGFLHAEMSGSVPLTVTVLGIPTVNGTACFGRTTIDPLCSTSNTPVYRDVIGTRVNQLDAQSIPLQTDILGLSGYAWITENLRFLHGFALVNTGDFAISVQREKVAYPTYTTNSSTAPASQQYSYPANAGWWMNVPDLKALDIAGARVTAPLSGLLTALGTPGLHLTDIELNMNPPSNCWGGNNFC